MPRGDNWKGFEDFGLKAKARIWPSPEGQGQNLAFACKPHRIKPWLSYMVPYSLDSGTTAMLHACSCESEYDCSAESRIKAAHRSVPRHISRRMIACLRGKDRIHILANLSHMMYPSISPRKSTPHKIVNFLFTITH